MNTVDSQFMGFVRPAQPAAAANPAATASAGQAASVKVTLTPAQRDAIIAELMERVQMNGVKPSASILELEKQAAEATTSIQSAATLHDLLARYHTSATPMGAAVRLHKYLETRVLHGTPLDECIAELSRDKATMRIVITGSDKPSTPFAYTMNGGEEVINVRPGAADAAVLLAQACDAGSSHYLRVPEAIRAMVAPGVVSMRTRTIPKGERIENLIWVVANSVTPHQDYAQGLLCLDQPRYLIVAKCPGVPDGLPVGTARVCNQGVIDAKLRQCWSFAKKDFRPKTVVFDAVPCWTYTSEGAQAMIRQVYDFTAQSIALRGDGQANAAGSALHQMMMAADATAAAQSHDVPVMSHASVAAVSGSSAIRDPLSLRPGLPGPESF